MNDFQHDAHSDCQCGFGETATLGGGDFDMATDTAVQTTAQFLDEASSRYGPGLARALVTGAAGRGPMASSLRAVGRGPDALIEARPGDIVVARDHLAKSAPSINIVDFAPGQETGELIESLGEERDIFVVRPEEGLPQAAATLGVVNLAAQQTSKTVIDVVKALDTSLDFGLKVGKLLSADRGDPHLDFKAQAASLTVNRVPFNTRQSETSGRFLVHCLYSPNDLKTAAKFSFNVKVQHDCLNILGVEVLPGAYRMDGGMDNNALADKLSITFKARRKNVNRHPVTITYDATGTWKVRNVFGSNPQVARFSFRMEVSANGRIKVFSTRSRRVMTALPGKSLAKVALSGRVPGSCQPLYDRLKVDRAYVGKGKLRQVDNVVHILFGTASRSITDYTRTQVDQWWSNLPQRMKASIKSGDTGLIFEGHSDPRGDARMNFVLSRRRAETLRDYVLNTYGSRIRITVQAKGEDDSANARPSEYSLWRRVSILVDKQK